MYTIGAVYRATGAVSLWIDSGRYQVAQNLVSECSDVESAAVSLMQWAQVTCSAEAMPSRVKSELEAAFAQANWCEVAGSLLGVEED